MSNEARKTKNMNTPNETPEKGQSASWALAVGSALYHRVMAYDSTDDLTHKVWDGTPWMVEAYTDSINSQRWQNVMEWCREYCGPEAWPIHGKAGKWHSGGATVNGETWMGFADEQMMNDFNAKWQNNRDVGRDECAATKQSTD